MATGSNPKRNGIFAFLGNIKISRKIVALVALPSLAAIIFLYSVLDARLQVLSEARIVQELSTYIINASALVHELQKERGASAVFISSQGSQMVSELSSQRRRTSSAMTDFEKFQNNFDDSKYSKEFEGFLKSSKDRLRELASKRNRISALNIGKNEAIKYYTSIITSLIHSFEQVVLMTDDPVMSNPVSAYVNFITTKEYAGIERARMSGICAGNKPIESFDLTAWMFVWQGQEALTREFKYLASKNVLDYYEEKYRGKIVNDVDDIRETLISNASRGNFGISGGDAFKATTLRINLMKEIEDMQVGEIEDLALSVITDARQSVISNIVIGLAIFTVVILFSIVVISGIIKPLKKIVALVSRIAEGDLTVKSEIYSKDEIGDLSTSFDILVEKLNTMITKIRVTSKLVAEASNGISTSSEEMAAGAEEQQAQLSEVATSIEEMSAMILETSNNTERTQKDANNANQAAEQGRGAVEQTISGMGEIATIVTSAAEQINTLKIRSQEIADVIQVIDDISDQTNLLALNANIEAARAGEAGRGFAVVADEVRKLAERTVGATADIEEKIKQIQTDVSSSVDAMAHISEQSQKGQTLAGEAGIALGGITSSIEEVNKSITQIAAAAIEQSAGVEEISTNVESVSTVSKESASGAQALAVSADQLNHEVLGLDKLIAEFHI